MSTLKERFNERFGDVRINESRNGSYQELTDLYGSDLLAFFHQELMQLAEEIGKRKWTDDGQVANYDKENAQAFYNHNTSLDEAAEVVKAKANELLNN